MQVVLVMFRNDGERRSFSVVRNMTIIGRREDCDLRIPVSDVSRKHCRLVRTDDGIRIEDLGSSNGTYVNGERIQECDLNAGDLLGVGPVQFTVQIDGVPGDDELTPPSAAKPAQQAAMAPAPTEEMASELTELEEIPTEDEFAIEEEPAAIEEEPVALEEEPLALEEEPAAIEPEPLAIEEEPVADLEDFATEHSAPLQLDDESLNGLPELPTDENLGDQEFLIEDSAGEPEPTAPVAAPQPTIAEPPAEPQPVAEIPLDDFEELTLEESPTESVAPAPPKMPAPPLPVAPPEFPAGEADELEFDEASLDFEDASDPLAVNPPAIPVGDHLEGELELDESALVEESGEEAAGLPAAPVSQTPAEEIPLAESHPAEPPVVQAPPAPLELATNEPAYDEVSIDSDPDEFEVLTLDEAPATNGEAGESSWDFVIEEADNTRSHHDFKLDLDSPHEQTHG